MNDILQQIPTTASPKAAAAAAAAVRGEVVGVPNIVCLSCYQSDFSPTCGGCSAPIFEETWHVYNEKAFHHGILFDVAYVHV